MTHIQETYSVAIEGMFTLRRLHACPRVRPRAGLYRRGWFWELKWIEWNIAYRLVWTGAPPPPPLNFVPSLLPMFSPSIVFLLSVSFHCSSDWEDDRIHKRYGSLRETYGYNNILLIFTWRYSKWTRTLHTHATPTESLESICDCLFQSSEFQRYSRDH